MHLMIAHRVPLHVAFHHINRMRPQANPNEGFKLQPGQEKGDSTSLQRGCSRSDF